MNASRTDLDELARQVRPEDEHPAPTRNADPRTDPIQDYRMFIARDGTWYHEGTAFTRHALVKLFSTVLRRTDDGRYMLVTPVERGVIEVEDAPFVAVEMTTDGTGRDQSLRFRTNVDDWVTADANHPIRVSVDRRTGEPSPYVLIRDGLEALIARPVFYDLVELGVETERDGKAILGVWSAGTFFPLGGLSEAT